jgi:hypothetical protein
MSAMEAMCFDESIDHSLYKHMIDEMNSRQMDSRIYQAAYLVHTNGGLQAADLLSEVADDPSVNMIPDSPHFKKEVVDHLTDQDSVLLDHYVKQQLVKTLQ